LVVGIERYPLKITNKMGVKRIAKRSRIKPFVKLINYNHLLPTRYIVDIELKNIDFSNEALKNPTRKRKIRQALRAILQERYSSGKNKWLFQKLRF
jgi:large subunit ribosomal protein L27e